MNPRLVLLVVLSVALAGCAMGGQFEGDVAGAPGTAPTTATPGNATDATPGPPYETPLDGTRVLAAHEAALDRAGTFTFVTVTRVREPSSGWRTSNGWHVAADVREGRLFIDRDRDREPDYQVYVDDASGRYRYVATARGPTYERPTDGPGLEDFLRPNLARFLEGIDFTRAGTTIVDGETAYVYAARGTAAVDDALLDLRYYHDGSVDEANATLVVGESGVIHRFDFRVEGTDLEGDTIHYVAPLAYRDVGNTTVREPPWLEAARSAGNRS